MTTFQYIQDSGIAGITEESEKITNPVREAIDKETHIEFSINSVVQSLKFYKDWVKPLNQVTAIRSGDPKVQYEQDFGSAHHTRAASDYEVELREEKNKETHIEFSINKVVAPLNFFAEWYRPINSTTEIREGGVGFEHKDYMLYEPAWFGSLPPILIVSNKELFKMTAVGLERVVIENGTYKKGTSVIAANGTASHNAAGIELKKGVIRINI